MPRPLVAFGGLFLLVIAGTACAAPRLVAAKTRCWETSGGWCHPADAANPEPPALDLALDAAWKSPDAGSGSAARWDPASPASASGTGATERSSPAAFSPGQSTGEGQHLVEWTLLTAPIAAYALSPVIDHRLAHDNRGIWKRSRQLDLEYVVGLTELGGALWLGGNNRLGRTFWKSIDSSLYTAVTVQAMKYAFSRSRPYQANNPNLWFQGNCCQSFPSGEVSFQASFVTPFIAEYYKQDPWIWALEALPAYDAMARMKAQGHWQTDVLAAWAIGTAWGLYAHFEPKPLVLSIMPDGIAVGLHVHF